MYFNQWMSLSIHHLLYPIIRLGLYTAPGAPPRILLSVSLPQPLPFDKKIAIISTFSTNIHHL